MQVNSRVARWKELLLSLFISGLIGAAMINRSNYDYVDSKNSSIRKLMYR